MGLPIKHSMSFSKEHNDAIAILEITPISISECEYSSSDRLYKFEESLDPGSSNTALLVKISLPNNLLLRRTIVTDGERFWTVVVFPVTSHLKLVDNYQPTMIPSKPQIYDHIVSSI